MSHSVLLVPHQEGLAPLFRFILYMEDSIDVT